MKYKCIQSFQLQTYDDDGRSIENEYLKVKKGSVWEMDETEGRIIGGDVALNDGNGQWLELTQEHFEKWFEPYREDEV